MDYDSAEKSVKALLTVVVGAPIPFIICIVIVASLAWWAIDWRYGAIIDSLRERLAQRDEEIGRLKARPEVEQHATVTLETPPLPPRAPADTRAERSSALIRIRNAVESAKYSLDPQFRDHGALVLPELRSALLTAHKQFGLRLPKKLHDARTEVWVALEYFKRVRPLLTAGHDREAQEEAESFLDGLHSEK